MSDFVWVFYVCQKGYDDLQSIVPTCQQQSEFAMATQKISKVTVLQKSEFHQALLEMSLKLTPTPTLM